MTKLASDLRRQVDARLHVLNGLTRLILVLAVVMVGAGLVRNVTASLEDAFHGNGQIAWPSR